jgi:CheY-like chemotaxis protein
MRVTKPYILIVDDDPEDLQALSDEFTGQNPGIDVKAIECGGDLLRFLNECPTDRLPVVIVLDYNMPDISGPEVLHRLATCDRYKQIVKVMWSTSRRTKDMEECRGLGATHYLVKPGTIDELRKAVHQLSAIVEMAARLTL